MIYASVPVLQPPDQIEDDWRTWQGCGTELLIVDNTNDRAWEPIANEHGWSYVTFGKNVGVAAGWNIARAKFLAEAQNPFDCLLLFSASVRWLDGLPFVLDQIAEAANWKGCHTQHGFHALAWSRKVFEIAGTFDENYAPAGYDADTDWAYRLILAGILVANPDPMPHIEVNVGPVENARAVRMTNTEGNYGPCRELFCAKWGGEPSRETFTTPFNSGLPTSWWSPMHKPGMENV